MFKVGFGQDSHRFSEDKKRKLILGGVEFENCCGLKGNSDADVIIHAICNALEQSIGGKSFSVYADLMYRERGTIDSVEYLKVAVNHIQERGYFINNLGITVEAKQPMILPMENDIKNRLAPILNIKSADIGINATSGEEMTSFGKGEGIQVFAIVSLIKNS